MITEQTEDLTQLDQMELGRRLDLGRIDRDGWAVTVTRAVIDGDDEHLIACGVKHFKEAEAALEVLYAENSRRLDAYRAAGLI